MLVGPDRCGKTTISDYLKSVYPDYTYTHHTNPYRLDPPVPPFDYFANRIRLAPHRTIFDRSHLCEEVYGNVFRGGSGLTSNEMRMLDLAALSRGVSLIVMRDTVENIGARWDENEMFPPDNIARLLEGYKNGRSLLAKQFFTLPDLLVDGQPTDVFKQLMAEHDSAIARLTGMPYAATGLGSVEPGGFLFVRNKNKQSENFPFWAEHDSIKLWDNLDRSNIEWWRGYYTYAGEHLKRVVQVIQPQRIMCWDRASLDIAFDCLPEELHDEIWGMEDCVHSADFVNRFGNALGSVFYKEAC